jgi:hypothetical protein
VTLIPITLKNASTEAHIIIEYNPKVDYVTQKLQIHCKVHTPLGPPRTSLQLFTLASPFLPHEISTRAFLLGRLGSNTLAKEATTNTGSPFPSRRTRDKVANDYIRSGNLREWVYVCVCDGVRGVASHPCDEQFDGLINK